MSHKCLFLDIDGVLNTDFTTELMNGYTFVERRLIKRLKEIIDATGADIILSSDWRFLAKLPKEDKKRECYDALINLLNEYDLHITDTTTMVLNESLPRGWEIDWWRQAHPEYTVACALDDIADLKTAEPYHVWTNPHFGLTEKNRDQAIAMLNMGEDYASELSE